MIESFEAAGYRRDYQKLCILLAGIISPIEPLEDLQCQSHVGVRIEFKIVVVHN
jgi:hypothetical protein